MITTIEIETFIENFEEYDLIIDARSPKEYAYSHIPKAINLYALSDTEHHEVGTIYKQVSPFEARVKGAAFVCLNAAEHIKKLHPKYTPKAKIAIYCAKGGMRSSSLGTIFSSIGYRIDRIVGGYKSYRGFVTKYLESFPPVNFITLRGNTGCGKSELLQQLDNSIDLEGMANHYGSVFGGANGAQPSQKEFQNRLTHALLSLDRSRQVFIEGESMRIGSIMLPTRLYEMMETGMQVRIKAPLSQRIERTVSMYETIDDDYFTSCMEKITPYIPRKAKEEAIDAYASGNKSKTAEILLIEYYDKVYKKMANIDYELNHEGTVQTLQELMAIRKDVQ